MAGLLAIACRARGGTPPPAHDPPWVSDRAYRIVVQIEPRRPKVSGAVAEVEIDLHAALAALGGQGRPDERSLEVVAGTTRVPWRLDRRYAVRPAALRFAVPDERSRTFAVYFDVEGTARRAPAYPGPVGDGDRLVEPFGRREVAASAHDTFGDLDGDGDLDLLVGGTEPVLTVLENVGGARFEERGPLTSGGRVLALPADPSNRAWSTPELCDWDADGDQDLLVFFLSGPHINRVIAYERTTEKGLPVFSERGAVAAEGGRPVAGRVRCVDWDGDGAKDLVGSEGDVLALLPRATKAAPWPPAVRRGVYLTAGGAPIQLSWPRPEFADLDGDGDLDLLVGTEDGRIYVFDNTGTRAAPVLAQGRMIVFHGYMDAKAAVTAGDFDGDGRLDLVVGRYWQRSTFGAQPRVFGRMYRGAGGGRYVEADAARGAPHTERFQPADALRQNGVRAVDWDEDGRLDVLAGDTDGFVWLFRNTTGGRAPVFAPPERLEADGAPIRVWGEVPEGRAAGYARVEMADWDEDGRRDLLVADGRGWVTWFRNVGTAAQPRLAAGERIAAGGAPIDGTGRGSVAAADWDGDGLLDLLVGMVGEEPVAHADWPPVGPSPLDDRGILFYRNRGARGQPALQRPRWIRVGPAGDPLDLLRPNLGDVVDWDADGRADLVACAFEMDCRLFRNTAGPGERPRYDGDPAGEVILRAAVGETISGADAVDWNGDGDLDLLTGQGHGGSGIRFFERDYLEDTRAGTPPIARVVRQERRQP